jgi:hypothetical protein
VIAMFMPLADLQVNSVAASVTESPKTWNPVVVAGAMGKVVNGLRQPLRRACLSKSAPLPADAGAARRLAEAALID